MKVVSKLKNAALVFIMLAFAAVVVLEGVAVGQIPVPLSGGGAGPSVNVEQPVLEISKTMTSGKTTVPIRTKEHWTLEIAVTYNGQGDINKVKVDDRIPKRVKLVGATPSKGKVKGVEGDKKKGKKGGKIRWDIGTMTPGDEESLILELTAKFKKKGEYSLNEGAIVGGKIGKTKVKAGPTDPIIVYAEGERRRGGHHGSRMDRGGGMGGRWR